MKSKKRVRSTYPEARDANISIREAAAAYGIDCDVVNVREAKDQLSSLLDRAANGEQIIITSDGRPKAMIVRYRPILHGAKWTSRRAIRKLSGCEDSSAIIRREKDAGY